MKTECYMPEWGRTECEFSASKHCEYIETTGSDKSLMDKLTFVFMFVSCCILQSGSSLLGVKTLGGSDPVMSNSYSALAKCHDGKDGWSLGRLAGSLLLRMNMLRRETTVREERNSTFSVQQSEKGISDTLYGLVLSRKRSGCPLNSILPYYTY